MSRAGESGAGGPPAIPDETAVRAVLPAAAGAARSINSHDRLLRSVSRSFYLSLRILPGSVRPTLSLAYLLARASDSVADVATSPREDRIRLLRGLPASWPQDSLPELAGADRELIGALPDLLASLRESPDREEIERVWRTILDGQIFDITRFAPPAGASAKSADDADHGTAGVPPASSECGQDARAPCSLRFSEMRPPPAGSLTLAEAVHYTGLVAGCVGEFWTDICFKHVPDYSRESLETMRGLGFSLGCGLQWVNILRDRQADAADGRIYVPPEHFSSALLIARGHLADGARYADAVRPRRLRTACRLPLLLAERTLDLVAGSPFAARVKTGRWFVWRSLALAAWK